MKLWLISQTANNDYDTYDSAVVAAETEDVARNMNPRSGEPMTEKQWKYEYSDWVSGPEQVKVELIGEAKPETEAGVICASFNAG